MTEHISRGTYRRIYGQSLAEGERISAVSVLAECLLVRIIAHADDYGNITGAIAPLLARIAPLRRLSIAEAGAALDELVACGLLIRYEVDGRKYLSIPQWFEFQARPSNGRLIRRVPPPAQPDEPAERRESEVSAADALIAAKAPRRERRPRRGRLEWNAKRGWTGINDEHKARWAAAYPACDIERQLAAMSAWLIANPAKAHKQNWERFATNWLARAQDRGGDIGSNRPATPESDPWGVKSGAIHD